MFHFVSHPTYVQLPAQTLAGPHAHTSQKHQCVLFQILQHMSAETDNIQGHSMSYSETLGGG